MRVYRLIVGDINMAEKWIQSAIPPSHKGRLHAALGVPQGQKIPADKLAKAKRSPNEHIRKMANLASTLGTFK
jgi:hypothetical protein